MQTLLEMAYTKCMAHFTYTTLDQYYILLALGANVRDTLTNNSMNIVENSPSVGYI